MFIFPLFLPKQRALPRSLPCEPGKDARGFLGIKPMISGKFELGPQKRVTFELAPAPFMAETAQVFPFPQPHQVVNIKHVQLFCMPTVPQ